MKIIFLNTWRGELRDDLRAYIARHLDTTTVFCFQEADDASRGAYEDLFADDFVAHTAQRESTDAGWYGTTMYVKKDMTILEKGSLFTTPVPNLGVGIAGFVTLQLPTKQLTICNVHGVPQPGHKLDNPARLYQSETILSTLAHHEAAIIGGDFNLLPETKSVRTFVEHGYRNLITDYAIPTTRNRLTFERFPDNIQLFADYAFVSPEIEVRSFVVPDDIVSDHQPLELTIAAA